MWRWMRRFGDWAVNDFMPTQRVRGGLRAVYLHYEKAGLTLPDAPIPWNAEAVLVEAHLKLPAVARQKADFRLRLAGGGEVPAESLRPAGDGERHRVFFRLPPPAGTTSARVLWRQRVLTEVDIPVLPEEAFRRELRLLLPTVFARLPGNRTSAAGSVVSQQCRGLWAAAQLRSPVGLAPLADLDLRVAFEGDEGGPVEEVPVALSCTQMGGREALVQAVPNAAPRRRDVWKVRWMLGRDELAAQQVNVISPKQFLESLRISDTRYVVATDQGVHLRRQLPPPEEAGRVGPCFLVSSREAGMAGVCELQVRAQLSEGLQSPVLLEQTLLVSDGPTLFAPGTLDRDELHNVVGFELRLNGKVLGVLSLRPIPQASFTAEGGFKSPGEYAWSHMADDELSERLGRLMNG